jgi:hypothetical protein
MRIFSSVRNTRHFAVVFASLFVAGLACSSTTTTQPAAKPTTDNTPVSQADCNPRCAAKVQTCGVSSSAAQSGCKTICNDATTSQLDCFESKSCDELQQTDTLDALCPPPAKQPSGEPDASDNPTGSTTCDGKAFCKDSSTKAVCHVEDGIQQTDATDCLIGGCSAGKCGSCTSDDVCKNKETFCYCKDGTQTTVPLFGSCGSDGYCSISLSSGGPFCQDHGGPDESRGDAVYHCNMFWQNQ